MRLNIQWEKQELRWLLSINMKRDTLPEAEKEEQSRIILEHIFKFFTRVKSA